LVVELLSATESSGADADCAADVVTGRKESVFVVGVVEDTDADVGVGAVVAGGILGGASDSGIGKPGPSSSPPFHKLKYFDSTALPLLFIKSPMSLELHVNEIA
jgi:hypothetical protein